MIPTERIVFLTASFIVLISLSTAYLFARGLYRGRFFSLVAFAWIFNAIYLSLEMASHLGFSMEFWETNGVADSLPTILGIGATVLLYFALWNCGPSALTWTLRRVSHLLAWALFVAAGLWIGTTLPQETFARFLAMNLPHMTFSAVVLIRLGRRLHRLDHVTFLSLLRNEPIKSVSSLIDDQLIAPLPVEEISAISDAKEELRKSVRKAKFCLRTSFEVWGWLQFTYLLRQYAPDWCERIFYVALVLKILNGIGLMYWLRADFVHVGIIIASQKFSAELGALAAGVEHDMVGPLGSLSGDLHQLRDALQSKPALVRKISRMELMIDQVHAAVASVPVLREGKDYYERSFRIENLPALISGCVKRARKRHEQEGATFDWTPNPKTVKIIAYPERLRTAFDNILNNAVEAACRRGDSTSPLVTLSIHIDKERRLCAVEVRDNGVGMSEDDLRNATLPYYSRKPVDGRPNRGLGLFVANRIVMNHGGQIAFRTDGSSFTVVVVSLPYEGIG